MKKILCVIALIFAVLPAFTQDTAGDEYAKFQGVWYGETEGHFLFYIFIDDVFFTNLEGHNLTGKYDVDKDNIIFTIKKENYILNKWVNVQAEYTPLEWKYIFSADNLILVTNGTPITLTKEN